jgi:hypothetical protein
MNLPVEVLVKLLDLRRSPLLPRLFQHKIQRVVHVLPLSVSSRNWQVQSLGEVKKKKTKKFGHIAQFTNLRKKIVISRISLWCVYLATKIKNPVMRTWKMVTPKDFATVSIFNFKSDPNLKMCVAPTGFVATIFLFWAKLKFRYGIPPAKCVLQYCHKRSPIIKKRLHKDSGDDVLVVALFEYQ